MLPACLSSLLVSTLWLCSLLPSLASLPPSLPGETSVSCTDDSDCTPLGHKYGCFLYRCLNFLDSPLPRCVPGGAGGCLATETCHRHPLLRGEGLCFPSSQLEPCSSSPNNCSSAQLPECCGDWCCPQSYHSQWSSKRCFTHQECRTWATGNFCCDGDCCQELPEEEYYDYEEYLSTTEEEYLGTTEKDYMDTTGENYYGTVLPDPNESFSTTYEDEGQSSSNGRVQEREEGASGDNSSLGTGGTHASGEDENSSYTTLSNLSEDIYAKGIKVEVELESTSQEDERMGTTSIALEVPPPTISTQTTHAASTFGPGESVNTSSMTPFPMPSDTKSPVKDVTMVKEEAILETIVHKVDEIGNSSSIFEVDDNVWTMAREENYQEDEDVIIKIGNYSEAPVDSGESAGSWPSSPVAGWPRDRTAHREDGGQLELFLSLGATEEEGLELLEEEHDYDEQEEEYPEEETAEEKDADVEMTGQVFAAFTTSDPVLVHDMTRHSKISAAVASDLGISADMASDTLADADIASESGLEADRPSDPVTAADMARNPVIPATRPFFPHSSAIPDMRAGGAGLVLNTLLLSVLLIHLL